MYCFGWLADSEPHSIYILPGGDPSQRTACGRRPRGPSRGTHRAPLPPLCASGIPWFEKTVMPKRYQIFLRIILLNQCKYHRMTWNVFFSCPFENQTSNQHTSLYPVSKHNQLYLPHPTRMNFTRKQCALLTSWRNNQRRGITFLCI